jgi:hypothetical protein
MRLNFGITTADLYLINFPLKRNYQTKNKRILELEEIVEAHQFVEINGEGGKIVVLTQ